jgi:hypothetical protein
MPHISPFKGSSSVLHRVHRLWLKEHFASFAASLHSQELSPALEGLFVAFMDRFPQAYYNQCLDIGEKEFIASRIKHVSFSKYQTLIFSHSVIQDMEKYLRWIAWSKHENIEGWQQQRRGV